MFIILLSLSTLLAIRLWVCVLAKQSSLIWFNVAVIYTQTTKLMRKVKFPPYFSFI